MSQIFHLFGIRHHGPGSARSLLRALEQLRPDCLLIEGPPEAEPLLPLVMQSTMRPPVALLLYVPDEPHRSVYYPLTTFSPEWQALRYGLAHQLPVRLMDLPQAHQLGEQTADMAEATLDAATTETDQVAAEIRQDPLRWLARAAGDEDGERWWERMVEQRRDGVDLFAAIREAMTAVRDSLPPEPSQREQQREAWMRQTMRAARKEGYQRIAVVCGAWHTPALVDLPPATADAALLKGLPRVSIETTWVPWTDERLTYASGYGAGVTSPGWYRHLWQHPEATTVRWLVRVARLLRRRDLDVSSAHVIEAVRLADALAALRDRAQPGLPELNEATLAIICHGDERPLQLIAQQLIVGERLGRVPDETPMVPLQRDLTRHQRRLRLPAEATERTLDLDLRQPLDLERSQLLHRLQLLNVPWGSPQRVSGSKRGTFHEGWQIRWRPELTVSLIAAGVWGNTLLSAATTRAGQLASAAPDLATLTQLVETTLLADLPAAVATVVERLQAAVALASDVAALMAALPPLVNVSRYGSVRGTDRALVDGIIGGLVARICINLPGACASLDDEAAAMMVDQLSKTHTAIEVLDVAELRTAWITVLIRLIDQRGLHGLLAGRSCRLLLDGGQLDADEAGRRLGLALATAVEPATAGAWIEGFLKDSATILLHDERLLAVLDGWVARLTGEHFITVLPLLRRTFSTFHAPERRQIGQRLRVGLGQGLGERAATAELDHERAVTVLPLVAQLLGLSNPLTE